MTVETFKDFLAAMRAANVMQANIKCGDESMSIVFGPEPMPGLDSADPIPGGWKTDPAAQVVPQPSDPMDPDPLGLGSLDAPIAYDDPEVTL